MKRILPLATALAIAAVAVAQTRTPSPAPALAPGEIVAAAPVSEWVRIAPSDLLVMDLAPDLRARPRRVVIQLMPSPFSQGWIGNIRKLAAAHWWDGLSVNRVQDNYVVQWGDADAEDKAKARALPASLIVSSQSTYQSDASASRLSAELKAQRPWATKDAYAAYTIFRSGWPLATDYQLPIIISDSQTEKQSLDLATQAFWPVHCYGMVGVGRNLPPDTGTGAELYTVIGHAPRHLDRNIALVGRVIEGIEHLSSLPRGTGPLGFYERAEERVPILSVRIGSEVKDLPAYEYLSTESMSFAAYAEARANRRDPFFVRPAGGADICNIPVPVRRSSGLR